MKPPHETHNQGQCQVKNHENWNRPGIAAKKTLFKPKEDSKTSIFFLFSIFITILLTAELSKGKHWMNERNLSETMLYVSAVVFQLTIG